jgi:PAS domain S-box-containing protein
MRKDDFIRKSCAGKGGSPSFPYIGFDSAPQLLTVPSMSANGAPLRWLIDELPVGIWAIDSDNRITFVSRSVATLLGYSATELVGKHLSELMDRRVIDSGRRNLARRASGIAEDVEFEFLRKDGVPVNTALSSKPVYDHQGRYAGAVAVVYVKGKAERRSTPDEVLAESNRLEALCKSIGVGLATIGRDYRIRWMNAVLKQMFGDITGELCYEAVNHRTSICDDCGLSNIFEGRVTVDEHEHFGTDAHGEPVWSQIIATPIYDSSGRISEALETVVPITARKLAEEKLERSRSSYQLLSQKLQLAVERERSQIARDIHDIIGNELTSVLYDLHWLEGRLPPGVSDVHERFNRIKTCLTATLGSVKSLLTGIRPGVLDHLGLYAALEWQLKDFSIRTSVAYRAEGLTGESLLTPDQATAVFRVFQEALSNVGKHSRATAVNLAVSVLNGELTVKISDNGVGIDPNDAAAFDSFGLIGMRERMKYVGGSVEIERGREGGTIVRIQVPLPRAEGHK